MKNNEFANLTESELLSIYEWRFDMNTIKRYKLWFASGIIFFSISTASFIQNLYINSFIEFSLSVVLLCLALASSDIKEGTKNSINKFVGYIITPLFITILGAFVYGKTHDIVHNSSDILLFSINFFIIIFIINIFFRKKNVFFKKN